MRSKEEEEAKKAIQDAEIMIGHENYEDAKAKIQEAINLFPTVPYAQQMIKLCELRHLSETHKYFRKKSWPFTLFQLPTSSTESEVKCRYEKLRADLESLKRTLSGKAFVENECAIGTLDYTMTMFKEEKYSDPECKTSLVAAFLLEYDWKDKFKKAKDRKAAENAVKAIEQAKDLITEEEDFLSAKAKVEQAIKHFPTIRYGQAMLTLCNILCRHKFKPSSDGEIWPYVFQIPSSSTESEVNARFTELHYDYSPLYRWKFPGVALATEALRQARDSFRRCQVVVEDKKRKASPSSFSQSAVVSDELDNKKSKATAAAAAAAGNDTEMMMVSGTDGPNGSPEFTKLRKQIFDGMSQSPHYNPLSIYNSSTIKEEMKLVLDARFVKMTQKLFSLGGDNLEFLIDEEETIRAELRDLEPHGYDLKPLEERLDLLARVAALAKEGDNCDEKVNVWEGLIDKETVQLEEAKLQVQRVQCRIAELTRKKEVLKARSMTVKSECATLKSMVKKDNFSNIMKNV